MCLQNYILTGDVRSMLLRNTSLQEMEAENLEANLVWPYDTSVSLLSQLQADQAADKLPPVQITAECNFVVEVCPCCCNCRHMCITLSHVGGRS
jgi:hypothetical protein